MSSLYVSEEALFNEAADVVRLFTGEQHFTRLEVPQAAASGRSYLVTSGEKAAVSVCEDGRLIGRTDDSTVFLPLDRTEAHGALRQRRHQAKRALYRALSAVEERTFPWGSLTGIRPVKLFRELAKMHGAQRAAGELAAAYLVAPDRVELSRSIYAEQQKLLAGHKPGVCVYIGIPFCPSRCRYCSFIAQDVAGARRVRDQYLTALLDEIGAFASRSWRASCIYIGGGTPTTLSEDELRQLVEAVREAFPEAGEITLEAGRPDTITAGTMSLAAELGISRLSINPQTASSATLARIGRRHTAGDYLRAMELSRPDSLHVNSDMIIGLPGENYDDVMHTLETILAFAPENITVHALAVKKAADLALGDWERMDPAQAAKAADDVRERLARSGYQPYYLYRQKYMSGNLENVGYARHGTGCLYNVLHMEELASVVAFGAGAISKRLFPGARRIERSANVKNAAEYVARLDEMISRKQQLFRPDKSCADACYIY